MKFAGESELESLREDLRIAQLCDNEGQIIDILGKIAQEQSLLILKLINSTKVIVELVGRDKFNELEIEMAKRAAAL